VEKKDDNSTVPTDVVATQEDSEFVRLRRKNWARLIAKIWQADPEICESCGERMQIVSAITHPHQDDVIEKVLRHRNCWNPPWQRQRRARGPPRQREFSLSEESQLPAIEEEDTSQEVPGADWDS